MFVIIKSILILAGCMVLGGILGFVGPLVISMFDGNGTAWSMIPMISVPFCIIFGFVIGLFIVFGFSFPMVSIPILFSIISVILIVLLIKGNG